MFAFGARFLPFSKELASTVSAKLFFSLGLFWFFLLLFSFAALSDSAPISLDRTALSNLLFPLHFKYKIRLGADSPGVLPLPLPGVSFSPSFY